MTLVTRDGRELASEVVEARAEPGDPAWEEIVVGKVARLADTQPAAAAASEGLAGLGADELIGVLAGAGGGAHG